MFKNNIHIKIYNFIIYFFIYVLSFYTTFLIFDNYLKITPESVTVIESNLNNNSLDLNKIEINYEDVWVNNTTTDIIEYKAEENVFDFQNYYLMWFKDKNFILSNKEKSYNIWFITKEIKDNILYLYSHNSYKYSENSWRYLYLNLKQNDEIVFNNKYKYNVVKTDIFDFDKNPNPNITLNKDVNVIYFTCTPLWENVRKVYYLKIKE